MLDSWNSLIKPDIEESKDLDPVLELGEIDSGSCNDKLVNLLSPVVSSIPTSPSFKFPTIKPEVLNLKLEIVSLIIEILSSKDFGLNELIIEYTGTLQNLILPFVFFLFLNFPEHFNTTCEYLSTLNYSTEKYSLLDCVEVDELCVIFIEKIVEDIRSFHSHLV